MGKQQISQLTFFDYVVGITIGSIASTLSVQVNQNTSATLAGMAVWTVLPILLGYAVLHNVWVRKVVEGEATVLIENGKILEENLGKVRLTIEDLITQLRINSVFNIKDVEFALFETNGQLSIIKKADREAVTAGDININVKYKGLPTNLILDGILLKDALRSLGLSEAWLMRQLAKQNIKDIGIISLAQLDTEGYLYVDIKGDGAYFIIPISN